MASRDAIVPSAAIQGLSGALSGVMSLALMYPLDNIRTRMQSKSGDLPEHELRAMRTNMKESISQAKMLVQHVGSRADIYAAIQQVEDLHAVLREQLEGLPSVTKSAGDKSPSKQRMAEEEAKKSATLTVAMVLQKEGFFGFYKGLSSGLVSYAATWSTYYFSYYKLREYFIREDYSMKSSLVNLSNSTFAGIITCIVTNPLWVVNTRLKLAKKKSSGWTLLEVQKMIAEEGVGSCFKGLGASLVLVTNPAIQFLLVEKLNDWMLSSGWNSETITPMHRFFIGAISKLISTLITYPLQIIKTRQQEAKKSRRKKPTAVGVAAAAAGGGEDSPAMLGKRIITHNARGSPRVTRERQSPEKKLRSSGSQLGILYSIISQEGIGGLYRGLSVKITQTVLTSAFLMCFQDIVLRLLAKIFAAKALRNN